MCPCSGSYSPSLHSDHYIILVVQSCKCPISPSQRTTLHLPTPIPCLHSWALRSPPSLLFQLTQWQEGFTLEASLRIWLSLLDLDVTILLLLMYTPRDLQPTPCYAGTTCLKVCLYIVEWCVFVMYSCLFTPVNVTCSTKIVQLVVQVTNAEGYR